MKTKLFFLVLLTTSVSTSFAQVTFGGGAHSGLAFTSFPQPLTDYYGTGFGFGAHGDLNIIPELALRLNVDYNTFTSDKDKLKARFNLVDAVQLTGANVTIFGLTANVHGKLPTSSIVKPYGILGLGLQILSQSDLRATFNGQDAGTLQGAPTTTNFGVNFGSGLEFGLGRRTNLFIEAKYALFFDSGGTSSYIPVTIGVSF